MALKNKIEVTPLFPFKEFYAKVIKFSSTLAYGLSIMAYGPSILASGPSILGYGLSILVVGLSILV